MGYKINYSVYKITNITTNKCYIGVDSYFPKRLRQHKSLLLNNKHKNKYLQNSYNKYGIENFTFELLEKCETRELMLAKEKELIKQYNSLENGYNHTLGGEGSFGYKHDNEALLKMSAWKRIVTPEWCKAISNGLKGIPKKPGIKRINHPDYSKWVGGEKHPVARFKQIEIHTMRKLYCQGVSLIELSKQYNTSKTYMCSIVNNSFWHDPNYVKDVITNHVLCVEDNLEFKSIKEAAKYYQIVYGTLTNILRTKSKTKTKYGKRSFKKVSFNS